jgi:hypothetical protein
VAFGPCVPLPPAASPDGAVSADVAARERWAAAEAELNAAAVRDATTRLACGSRAEDGASAAAEEATAAAVPGGTTRPDGSAGSAVEMRGKAIRGGRGFAPTAPAGDDDDDADDDSTPPPPRPPPPTNPHVGHLSGPRQFPMSSRSSNDGLTDADADAVISAICSLTWPPSTSNASARSHAASALARAALTSAALGAQGRDVGDGAGELAQGGRLAARGVRHFRFGHLGQLQAVVVLEAGADLAQLLRVSSPESRLRVYKKEKHT